jgi:selenide,water dikinase
LTEDIALIQTLDFFTPIVDDPFAFGQITAANALSDVYAMGGKPILAMNILACPIKSMEISIFREIIKGGLSKVEEAGALLVGGHSVEDAELKYGLSVTGTVHPDRVLLNSGAKPGDNLILTKPLGTGILSTAIKGNLARPETEQEITAIMATLNRLPADAIAQIQKEGYEVHACTDITGFGLLGHLYEMTVASGVSARLHKNQIPVIPGCLDFVNMGIIPEGAYANRKFYSQWLNNGKSSDDALEMLLVDPQTSGGLLIAAPPEASLALMQAIKDSGYNLACSIIGEIGAGNTGVITAS